MHLVEIKKLAKFFSFTAKLCTIVRQSFALFPAFFACISPQFPIRTLLLLLLTLEGFAWQETFTGRGEKKEREVLAYNIRSIGD